MDGQLEWTEILDVYFFLIYLTLQDKLFDSPFVDLYLFLFQFQPLLGIHFSENSRISALCKLPGQQLDVSKVELGLNMTKLGLTKHMNTTMVRSGLSVVKTNLREVCCSKFAVVKTAQSKTLKYVHTSLISLKQIHKSDISF